MLFRSPAEAPTAAGPRGRTIEARIAALDADRAIVVRFTDADGLVNREPITFVLSAIPDEPPRVALRLRGISTAVTPRARLPLALRELHRCVAVGGPVSLTMIPGDHDGCDLAGDDFPGRWFALWDEDAIADVVLGAGFECGRATPDVIVFDGSAGDPAAFTAGVRMRPGFGGVRVVASGTNLPDDERQLLRAGCAGALHKPYSVRALVEAVGLETVSRYATCAA